MCTNTSIYLVVKMKFISRTVLECGRILYRGVCMLGYDRRTVSLICMLGYDRRTVSLICISCPVEGGARIREV